MKLSPPQRAVLEHLAKRGHAMTSWLIATDMGVKYIDMRTLRRLAKHECVRFTDQGWLITDLGRDTIKTGVLP